MSYIFLGDMVGWPTATSEAVVQRIQKPRRGELTAQVCPGWWKSSA